MMKISMDSIASDQSSQIDGRCAGNFRVSLQETFSV